MQSGRVRGGLVRTCMPCEQGWNAFGQCYGHGKFVSQAVDAQAGRSQACFSATAQLLMVENEDIAHY